MSTMTRGSIRMPMVTKKSATNASRSESNRAKVSCPYSDALMIRPARKAPRARESPIIWVTAAVPRLMARVTSRNSSWFCVLATCVMIGGMTLAPKYPNGARISRALIKASPIRSTRPESNSPRAGMSTVIATTATSSTRAMPIITCPCFERSSPRSKSIRASTMVLAMEMTAPITMLCVVDHPIRRPVATANPMAMRIPIGPPASATHLTRIRSFTENSSPIENIKRMTPISAKRSNV